jgi:putative hemolysin
MSEIALVSEEDPIGKPCRKGDENAKVALELSQNPEVFLSTAQIGITWLPSLPVCIQAKGLE